MMSGQWLVDESTDTIWSLLTDPQRLVQNIPGVLESKFDATDNFQLVVDVDTGIGVARYRFNAAVVVLEDEKSLRVIATGVNAHNIVKFTADVGLEEQDGQTSIQYFIDASAYGGLASVAQRTVSQIIVRHVQDWLQTALTRASQPA